MVSRSIKEGEASISLTSEDKISKSLPVFYNPVMKLNRDISIILLNALGKKGMQMCDPLAGTGIRSLRFLKELKQGIAESVTVNDANPRFPEAIKANLKRNKLKQSTLDVHNVDAISI